MKEIQEMKNTLLALLKNNSTPEWEMSEGQAQGNKQTGFAVGGVRPEVRVAAETSSKTKDQIQGSDDQTGVCDTDMGV